MPVHGSSESPIGRRQEYALSLPESGLLTGSNGDSDQTGGVAHVVFGSIKFDLVIIQVGGKLLVDDELCTGGGASTSIYVQDHC